MIDFIGAHCEFCRKMPINVYSSSNAQEGGTSILDFLSNARTSLGLGAATLYASSRGSQLLASAELFQGVVNYHRLGAVERRSMVLTPRLHGNLFRIAGSGLGGAGQVISALAYADNISSGNYTGAALNASDFGFGAVLTKHPYTATLYFIARTSSTPEAIRSSEAFNIGRQLGRGIEVDILDLPTD